MAMIATETLTRPAASIAGVFRSFTAARALRRQRAALKSLDAERLADLGISQTEALLEARRPAWDVPSHWRR